MILTEERVVPKLMKSRNGILKEHIARYVFARDFARGQVLDIACGVGYGTEILLKDNPAIRTVVGVDIDEAALDYARTHYDHPKVRYLVKDVLATTLPQELGQFDTVVSFETVEHFKEDEQFIDNLYRLMNPDGTLVISTPFGRGRGMPCSDPFHVHQYKESEFVELLSCFETTRMYYQVDETIEMGIDGKKYYLMVAVCHKKKKDV